MIEQYCSNCGKRTIWHIHGDKDDSKFIQCSLCGKTSGKIIQGELIFCIRCKGSVKTVIDGLCPKCRYVPKSPVKQSQTRITKFF